MVNIKTNTLINNIYIDVPYYLVYGNVSFNFTRINFHLYNLSKDISIVKGRLPNRAKEIIVSEKYYSFLGKTIQIDISKNRYYFEVVGIYKSDIYIINKSNYIFTCKNTFDLFYKDNTLASYSYIFYIDNYRELNREIDILKRNKYEVYIDNRNIFVKNNRCIFYDSICTILLFSLFITIVFLFLHLLLFNGSLN